MLDWGLWEVTALGFFMGYKAIKKKRKEKVRVEPEVGNT